MSKKQTKKRIKIPKKKLEAYWEALGEIESQFHKNLSALEDKISLETGIKDIEFFWCDNSIVGIGDAERTMRLIHRY